MAAPPDSSTPIAALPDWWLRTGCLRCRVMVDVPMRTLVDRGVAGSVGDAARRLRCRRCGGQPSEVVLASDVTGMPDYGGVDRPRAEVRLV